MCWLSVQRIIRNTRVFSVAFSLLLGSACAFAETTMGEDGLHKPDWFSLTFKDVAEDIADAKADDKRLVLIFEQRGCIYCDKMHKTVLNDPEVVDYLKANYQIVQINLFGDEEVTDMDGEVLSEKDAAVKWEVFLTPTMIFLPEEPVEGVSVAEAAIVKMPIAFGKLTFLHLFQWVKEKGYEGDEHFQKYHARKIELRRGTGESVEE